MMEAVVFEPKPEEVLSQAVLSAAQELDLRQKDVAQVIGVSDATLSRIAAKKSNIDPSSKEGELGLLLIRLFRNLRGLLGEGPAVALWMRAPNHHLGAIPAEYIKQVSGLVETVYYLDALRGQL